MSSAADATIELGANATGNHYAYIDLTGDATYTDYGLRIIRSNTGPDATSIITARGTGGLYLKTAEAGPVIIATTNTERVRVDQSGQCRHRHSDSKRQAGRLWPVFRGRVVGRGQFDCNGQFSAHHHSKQYR